MITENTSIKFPGEYSLYAPKPDTHAHHNDHGDEARTVLGFWIYLMTDCILFATLFAVFAVFHKSFYGGPTGKDIFEISYILIETFCLLISSVTYGMAMLAFY